MSPDALILRPLLADDATAEALAAEFVGHIEALRIGLAADLSLRSMRGLLSIGKLTPEIVRTAVTLMDLSRRP